jgi:hypothetical protein
VSAIAHNQGLAMGALFSNPQVSIHTHNYATHLEMFMTVVFFIASILNVSFSPFTQHTLQD